MSSIRRQSIISVGIIYVGFAIGLLNTYLFTREGGFTEGQYGLYGIFISIANIMYSFANLGMQAYIYKFYPYYYENLPIKKNDMITWALLVSIMGFVLVTAGGFIFKDLVIRKFAANSAELVKYYYWIFPLGFGLTIYSLLEAFSWQLKESVLTNYLREVQWRLFTTVLIILYLARVLTGFDAFIKLFAFTYPLLALALLAYLVITKKIQFSLSPSRVTKKFLKKILTLAGFIWSGGLVYNIASFFAMIVIAAVVPEGLSYVGVYTLAQNIASLIQAPQRGIISASLGPLSKAWKDKNYRKINHIYHRSSINQLIFSTGMFVLIWINFTDGVFTFHLHTGYLQARYVFLFIGLMRIIDMGTGVNKEIIGTSTFWRFEFLTGIILLALTLPLNYILAKQIGVIGPAIADLFTFTLYNAVRFGFLYRKFNMQPFTIKSFFAILAGLAGFLVCHFLFRAQHGFGWIALRSFVFVIIYLTCIVSMDLSPDVLPVWETVKKRLMIKRV
ncbi:MAG TPA: polysaccharide biosynthesis C-terminal domain-containing protein [Puia sp.]|nr:polysaccharide biosynthesis C-terminal domain-containing protein [Puia sp.]